MKGNDDVIQILNDVLSAELTGINQYMVHAEMRENWGYQRLAGRARKEAIEEMKHAEQIIERILYLDGLPNMQKYMKINVGKTVPEQHGFDLLLEQDAIERLNTGVALCREKGDNGTRALLEKILMDEEGHLDWIEAQLQQIQDIGVENYLSQQFEQK
jgi:bacterioferritin